MKKVKWIAMFLILGMASTLNAQIKVAEIPKSVFEEASKRTTLVALLAEDPKVILKLKKTPDDIVAYKNNLAEFNERLKATIQKDWHFTEKYEFHTMAEILKLAKGKTAKSYLILQWMEKTAQPVPPSNQKPDINLPYEIVSNSERWGMFELRLAENWMPQKPALLIQRTMFIAPPTLMENIFTIHILQYELENKKEGFSESDVKANLFANAKLLLSKTLLIDNRDIDLTKFGAEQVDRKYYSLESQITDEDSFVVRLAEQNPDYAFVKILPNEKNELVHYIISCEDGVVCNTFVAKFDGKQKRKQRISAEALKGYMKNVK